MLEGILAVEEEHGQRSLQLLADLDKDWKTRIARPGK